MKKNKIRKLPLTDFQTNYKSRQNGTAVKVDTYINWDQRRGLEIDLHNYGQLIFHKGTKAIQWKRESFVTNDAGRNGYPYSKPTAPKELQLIPGQYIKINSKWINDLNIKPKIRKLLEENVRKNLYGIGLGNVFFK